MQRERRGFIRPLRALAGTALTSVMVLHVAHKSRNRPVACRSQTINSRNRRNWRRQKLKWSSSPDLVTIEMMWKTLVPVSKKLNKGSSMLPLRALSSPSSPLNNHPSSTSMGPIAIKRYKESWFRKQPPLSLTLKKSSKKTFPSYKVQKIWSPWQNQAIFSSRTMESAYILRFWLIQSMVNPQSLLGYHQACTPLITRAQSALQRGLRAT